MNKYMVLTGMVVALGLSGCTGMMGKSGVDAVPRLVKADVTEHPQKVVWSHTERFGAVPKELQASGDQYCRQVNHERAIGYHPKALGVQGEVIPGGGFYCSSKKS